MPPSETGAGEGPEDGRLVWLDTPSNWRLALRDFTAAAPDPDKPAILVFAAMGAPARAYRRLSRWFAGQGYPIATLDLRGTGESLPIPRRGIDFGVSQHLYEDWPAAVAWAQRTYPGRKLVLLGHSIGGQLSGVYAGQNPGAVAALVLLTTTSVWFRSTPFLTRQIRGLYAFTAFSLWARWHGWLDGAVFNWGLPLARQVVLDWARWGFSGHYSDSEKRNLDGDLAAVDLPVLSVSFSDDSRLAPKEACDDFIRRLPKARLTRWHLAPQEVGLAEAGHFAHLRGAEPLWRRIDSWLAAIVD
ncbi:MAG: alpha/beta fold hydrolase [Reyranellaceae bacterium]